MNLEYSGKESIPASKDAVWAFITDPANIQPRALIPGVPAPQSFSLSGDDLLVTSSIPGGSIYRISLPSSN